MSPLILSLLLTAAPVLLAASPAVSTRDRSSAPAGPCFFASDATPGWKHVTLPFDAYALAAPDEVDQFRSNEAVTIVDHRSGVFLSGRDVGAGVTAFDFSLGEGGRSLDIEFTESLQGAKVDVSAYGEFGSMSLMREQRIGSTKLNLTWGQTQVHSVVVHVHHHMRKEPVLHAWRGVRRIPSARLSTSEAFRLDRSLYYRQPPGPAVMLCHDPDRELKMRPDMVGLKDRPMPVLLKK